MQQISDHMCSDDGRRQGDNFIIWSIDGIVHWRIYVSYSLDKLIYRETSDIGLVP